MILSLSQGNQSSSTVFSSSYSEQQHDNSKHMNAVMNGWNCGVCTYLNEDAAGRSCLICESARSESAAQTNVHSYADHDGPGKIPSNNESSTKKPGATKVPGAVKVAGIGAGELDRKASLKFDELAKEDGGDHRKTEAAFKEAMEMSFAGWTEEDKEAWECPSCTYVNKNSLHLLCEVCGGARNSKPAPVVAPSTLEGGHMSFATEQEFIIQQQKQKMMDDADDAVIMERLAEHAKYQEEELERLQTRQD